MPDPYGNAASAYQRGGQTTLDQRHLEATALLKAASRLEALRQDWQPARTDELDEALVYNRKLWTVFAAEAADGADRLPRDLRNNIANLSLFVFRRSVELHAVAEIEKIDALIDINRSIAAGLLMRQSPPATAGGKPAPVTGASASA
jgi:flagellar protein FlaF